LNGALDEARLALSADARLLALPGDLAKVTAADLDALVALADAEGGGTVVLVTDRHGRGTNALLLAPPDVIDPRFGGDSFPAHTTAGEAVGATVVVLDGPLAVDIDTVPGLAGVTLWKTDKMSDLLGQSDVVVICLPLTKATRHLFTRDLFRKMRRHALLINVTRGHIVFGEDLLTALDEGLIGGAGLDVTDPEPLPAGHRLWTHPRAVVTPHTAGGSPRRAGRVIATFIENLQRLRDGRPLLALIDKQKGY